MRRVADLVPVEVRSAVDGVGAAADERRARLEQGATVTVEAWTYRLGSPS